MVMEKKVLPSRLKGLIANMIVVTEEVPATEVRAGMVVIAGMAAADPAAETEVRDAKKKATPDGVAFLFHDDIEGVF